jgi:beta-glucanase (GH16 family)
MTDKGTITVQPGKYVKVQARTGAAPTIQQTIQLEDGDTVRIVRAGAPPPPPPPPTSTFYDDFSNGLQAQWLNSPCGPFGAETTEFRNDLCRVVNGILEVQAVRDAPNKWRCGHLSTWGDFEQEFGVWEARIKIPKGRGLWPAFWPLKSGTSACAGGKEEFDIMEILANPIGERNGEDASLVFQTLHFGDGSQKMSYTRSVDLSLDYHVYGMEWRADFVQFTLDGNPTSRWTGQMRGKAHIRLNMAVGGWPGPSDASTPSPAAMLVDWVKVQA